MNSKKWMIYGANGYSGKQIAEKAVGLGLKPILAGRNQYEVSRLAEALNVPFQIFDLSSPKTVNSKLSDCFLILNCAGPFSATSKTFGKACLETKTHYLDITGEIGVFEKFFSLDQKFKEAGVTAIPGVGFDVVPSDTLINIAYNKFKSATHLNLYLKSSGRLSPGTTNTMIEGFYVGAATRKNGQIVINSKFEAKTTDISGRQKLAVLIPWGDVSTAYRSTHIPNVNVYLLTSKETFRFMRAANSLKTIFKTKTSQYILKKLTKQFVQGPSPLEQKNSPYFLWVELIDNSGKTYTMGLETPNGYLLTTETAVKAVQIFLEREVKPGAITPFQAFGEELLFSCPGVKVLNDDVHQDREGAHGPLLHQ